MMQQSHWKKNVCVALIIACVYGYFLLFAQFAFLETLGAAGLSAVVLKVILGSMAVGGMSGCYVAARRHSDRIFQCAILLCLLAAVLSVVPCNSGIYIGIAFLLGFSLGIVTVCIAGRLPFLLDGKFRYLWVGVGTGLGYAACNVPIIFSATPFTQSIMAAAMMFLAFLLARGLHEDREIIASPTDKRICSWFYIAIFFLLVWLDSAAFYVIQHAPELKRATWGEPLLWRNAGLHFAAAVVAGYLLDLGLWRAVLLSAVMILGAAAWWVNHESTRLLAGVLYPVAVSLYSTALVCWAGLEREKSYQRAAWLFAIAGWFGSTQGIGMVEHLHRVPGAFVLAAVGINLFLLVRDWKKCAFVLGLLALTVLQKNEKPSASAIERGRAVYVAEGCIHCHSRYHRPGSADENLWGKAFLLEDTLKEKPVLIGNRRQGPDLTNVGARRSVNWLREHFLNPQLLSPNSVMPSYAYLFQDQRGDDLISFLLDGTRIEPLADLAIDQKGDAKNGALIFSEHCAVCHGAAALGDGMLAKKMAKQPANLVTGPWIWSADERRLPSIIQHGIPGTDMAGHETWSATRVADVVAYLLQLRK